MTKKDWQRHLAYEALVILGVLALLLFVCRLWPILLLAMLGILAATLRLLFLSSTQVRPLEPMPPGAHKPPARAPEEVEASQAFGNLHVQITRQVREEYPNARWVSQTPRKCPLRRKLFPRWKQRLLPRHLFRRTTACPPLNGWRHTWRSLAPSTTSASPRSRISCSSPAGICRNQRHGLPCARSLPGMDSKALWPRTASRFISSGRTAERNDPTWPHP